SGTFEVAFGDTGSGDGQFNEPRDVAIDAQGRVYVCDGLNNRIQVFSESGTFLGKWGVIGTNASEFNLPFDLAFDAEGHLFIVDAQNNRIQEFGLLQGVLSADRPRRRGLPARPPLLLLPLSLR